MGLNIFEQACAALATELDFELRCTPLIFSRGDVDDAHRSSP